MAYDEIIANQVMEAADLVETTEYESAATGYQSIANEDLSQSQYKDRRRATKIIYSSIVVGYKVEHIPTYMYPRDHKKFQSRNETSRNTISL